MIRFLVEHWHYVLGVWVLSSVPIALLAGWLLGRYSRSAAVEAPAAPPRHGASTGARQMHPVRVSVTARSMN